MTIRRYANATAFRRALEDRIGQQVKRMSNPRIDEIGHLRRQVVFERLLVRLFMVSDPPWLLKGGFAMEMRLPGKARATKDVDLSITRPKMIDALVDVEESERTAVIGRQLQLAASSDLDDWFMYHISEPMHDLAGAPYGGARFFG